MLPDIPKEFFITLFALAAMGMLALIVGIIWVIWFLLTKVQITII